MPKHVQHGDAGPALRVRILVVDGPGDDDSDGAEEAGCSGVDAEIAPERSGAQVSRHSDEQIPRGAEQSVEDDKVAAVLGAVGEEGSEEDDKEGEEVRWGGEGLRGERGVGHFVDDGREEGGKAGEGDVAAEEHEGGEVAFWVGEGLADVVEVEFGVFFGEGVFFCGFGGREAELSDFLFAAGQEFGLGGAVGDLVPGDHGRDDAWGALYQEQQSPGCDWDVLAGFCDQPG